MEHTLNKDCWRLYKVLLGCFPHKTHNNSKPDLTAMCYHLPKVKLLIKLGKKSLFAKEKKLCDDSPSRHFQKSGGAEEKMERAKGMS